MTSSRDLCVMIWSLSTTFGLLEAVLSFTYFKFLEFVKPYLVLSQKLKSLQLDETLERRIKL